MVTAVAVKTPALFQVTQCGENSWSCLPVVYGSMINFKAMELDHEEMGSLFKTFHLPRPATNEDTFIVEFFDDMPVERLSKFGFRSSEQSYAV